MVEECVGDGVVVVVDWGGESDVGGALEDSSVTTLEWGGVCGGLEVCE